MAHSASPQGLLARGPFGLRVQLLNDATLQMLSLIVRFRCERDGALQVIERLRYNLFLSLKTLLT